MDLFLTATFRKLHGVMSYDIRHVSGIKTCLLQNNYLIILQNILTNGARLVFLLHCPQSWRLARAVLS